MEMLKVRVALEERLKQEGILRSKAPKPDKDVWTNKLILVFTVAGRLFEMNLTQLMLPWDGSQDIVTSLKYYLTSKTRVWSPETSN